MNPASQLRLGLLNKLNETSKSANINNPKYST